jgi:GT2 family glycosyltransferase
MNVGINAARGKYLYLTEDDVVLRPGCVDALIAFLASHPDVALAAPIMYNRRSGTIRSAGGRFSLGSVYAMTIHGENEPDRGQFSAPFDVTYIPGASICAETDLLQSMNGFREDFFVYHEDAELCMRVLKAGRRIVTVPRAKVDHFEPLPGPSSDFVDFCRMRNFFAVYLLHARIGVLPFFVARYGGLEMLRAIARDRRRARLLFKALTVVARDAPRLLSERDPRPFPEHVH